jgi:hypothetical protein
VNRHGVVAIGKRARSLGQRNALGFFSFDKSF